MFLQLLLRITNTNKTSKPSWILLMVDHGLICCLMFWSLDGTNESASEPQPSMICPLSSHCLTKQQNHPPSILINTLQCLTSMQCNCSAGSSSPTHKASSQPPSLHHATQNSPPPPGGTAQQSPPGPVRLRWGPRWRSGPWWGRGRRDTEA